MLLSIFQKIETAWVFPEEGKDWKCHRTIEHVPAYHMIIDAIIQILNFSLHNLKIIKIYITSK